MRTKILIITYLVLSEQYNLNLEGLWRDYKYEQT